MQGAHGQEKKQETKKKTQIELTALGIKTIT
jgi:hypothetical protein